MLGKYRRNRRVNYKKRSFKIYYEKITFSSVMLSMLPGAVSYIIFMIWLKDLYPELLFLWIVLLFYYG